MKRELGYYWVKYNGEWIIVEGYYYPYGNDFRNVIAARKQAIAKAEKQGRIIRSSGYKE